MRYILIALLLVAACGVAAADTVVTKDGRVLHGKIIQQNGNDVILEVTKYGANMQVALPKTEVASVKESPVFRAPTTKPASSAPVSAPAASSTTRPAAYATYFVIPIKGEIGKDVQSENVQQGLRAAKVKKADYVVFDIDSPGGSVAETEEILNVMTAKSDQRRLGDRLKALSSAAVLTMACNDIYMQPGATIGAAVPIPAGPNPQPIDEKILSAIRAMARSAAEIGNHNVLLIQGMMEPEIELGLTVKDNKPVVAAGREGKVIKEKGKILTLTAQESVACGLARDVVADSSAIGKSIGVKGWTDVTGVARAMSEGMSKRDRAKSEREAYLKTIEPQLEKIRQDLEKVDVDLKAAEANKEVMTKQYQSELATAKAQFDQAMQDASHFTVNQSAGMQANARSMYNGTVININARYQGMAMNNQDQITKLNLQKKQLQAEKAKLMNAAPRIPSY